MELTILERIILLSILPAQANYVTYKIVQNLKSELSFTEQEIKEWKIKEDNGRVTWESAKATVKTVAIGDKMEEIIREALKKLDEAGKVNSENVGLYEKFMK